MFTNQKIEPSQWPWSSLQIIQQPDQAMWLAESGTIPTIMPQNGIGSGHDVRATFKDSYLDLNHEVEYLSKLSQAADSCNYLA